MAAGGVVPDDTCVVWLGARKPEVNRLNPPNGAIIPFMFKLYLHINHHPCRIGARNI